MATSTVDTVRIAPGTSLAVATALDAGVVDQLLVGTGYVIEVERWPDECPAGLFPDDDPEFRDVTDEGLLRCYEVTLATASGTELARTLVWSAAGVVCGPYTSCTALGAALADEVAHVLGRALTSA